MIERAQLPELPLMLALAPRPVVRLLREAGIPSEPLPNVPLLAAGTGRFILFDAHNPKSAALARRGTVHGLKAINLRELGNGTGEYARLLDEYETGNDLYAGSATAGAFLEQLKAAVESLGGVWVRLADFPFPYQSAICVGIEHVSEDLTDFGAIAATLPGKATHFVSSRLRGDRMAFLSQSGQADLGWQIRADDCQASARSTYSHWATRMQRYSAANLKPEGLILNDAAANTPPASRLLQLGLRYACLKSSGVGSRIEAHSSRTSDATWVQFHTLELPPRERFVEWVGEHYQSGCPLFLSTTTERLEIVQELLGLAGDAGRCSLMWQTSFGEFARWWTARRLLKIQVWRTDGGHEIHAEGDFAAYPWSIEIWRAGHVATLPMRAKELIVPDDGLVYLHSTKRNPAGCTTPGDGVRNLVASENPGRLRDPFFTRSRFRRKGSPE